MPLPPMEFPESSPAGLLDRTIHTKDGNLLFPLFAKMTPQGGFTIDPQATYEFMRTQFPELPPYIAPSPPAPMSDKEYTVEELANMGDIQFAGGHVWMQTLHFKLWGIKWTNRKIKLALATLGFSTLMSVVLSILALLAK